MRIRASMCWALRQTPRVAVRLFISDPFEKNRRQYYHGPLSRPGDRQGIRRTSQCSLTVRDILDETVSKKSRDKDAAPLLAGSVFRAILTGAPYPAALYNAIITRVRADMDDKSKRISKINYVRSSHQGVPAAQIPASIQSPI